MENYEFTEQMLYELSDNKGEDERRTLSQLIRSATTAVSQTFTDSKLATLKRISPCNSGPRTHNIDIISPHCTAGICSAEGLGVIFSPWKRQASCNYGIGNDGRIILICHERNRSWCTSSQMNDQRAVTIEASSGAIAPYPVNETVWNALIKLCVDICRRNGKTKLLWLGSKEKTFNYTPKKDEMLLSAHRWFAAKACPGDFIYNREQKLADAVTAQLDTGYKVKIIKTACVRKKPSSKSKKLSTLHPGGVYTIVKEKGKWGKLKSGSGWISLKKTKRV